ncbi:hypothetical protein [Sphaerisporangium sp. NPDC051011]|uniref:hypothetical protein n=1 Tax=Sphaerisporangium sp. NPDC051011 TaxID=3155792 RepID=UPI00340CAA34
MTGRRRDLDDDERASHWYCRASTGWGLHDGGFYNVSPVVVDSNGHRVKVRVSEVFD